jgi:predicted DNA-binding transcriptional regulator AlpA
MSTNHEPLASSAPSAEHLGDLLLSVGNVATILGISRRTLDRWHDQDKAPPFFRLGRKLVCSSQDLQQWIAEKRHRAVVINRKLAA